MEALYRADYGTFEDYCRDRWAWNRDYVNKQIRAAEVIRNLDPIVSKPQNEAQARELARLAPEQQRKVWSAAVAQSLSGRLRRCLSHTQYYAVLADLVM